MQADLKNAKCYEHEIGHEQSDFCPSSQIRFSLTTRVFEKFLDILEILECVLQSIFEMQIEIPSGSVWKMVLKLGKKLA